HELEDVLSLHRLVLDDKDALCAGSVRRCAVEYRDPLPCSVMRRGLRSAGGDTGAVVGASVAVRSLARRTRPSHHRARYRQVESEGAADALLAFERDLAGEQSRQLAADGEA